MARKEDKLRPYRVDYFEIDQMREPDFALVKSTIVRCVTAAEAADAVIKEGIFGGQLTPPRTIIIRAYRYYKQLGTRRKDVFKAIEDLFTANKAADVMTQIDKYRAYAADQKTRARQAELEAAQCPYGYPAGGNGTAHECAIHKYTDYTPTPQSEQQKVDVFETTDQNAIDKIDVPVISGPNSPATQDVMKDYKGFFEHDEHEQIIDQVVVNSTDAEGRRYPTAQNTLDDANLPIALAVSKDLATKSHDILPNPSSDPANYVITSTGSGASWKSPTSLWVKLSIFALLALGSVLAILHFFPCGK